ncbi:MAG TPA: LacI family transcriptional regulator [Ruminiclostridium sp.]|jgi:DNA-binding LacI/PurR family transcriptional regulator|nr:LacI family transcriptional regulator [Ruminiclostridium sp.]
MGNVTIKDIARLAGVSPSTVSRAFNSRAGVGPEVKQKILDICVQTGYMPNALARGLVKKKTSTIGIMVPDVRSPFYADIIACAEAAARTMDYDVIWCNNFRDYEREEKYFRLFIENRLEGVIICPVGVESMDRLDKYIALMPTVVLGDRTFRKDISHISTDNYSGGCIAADYLIDLGHKDLMFVSLKEDIINYQQRLKGFKDTAERRGAHFRCLPGNTSEQDGLERGYHIFKNFLESGERMPEGVFAATDATALGIIKLCEEKRIRIPEEFSLIGFDDIIYSSLPRIMLTTVAQGKQELTEGALQILLKLIQNPTSKEFYETIVTPKLVERNSCIKRS